MSGANGTMWAWSTPAFFSGSPVDHTWVTTYDNGVTVYANDTQVAAAGEDYWYCWGSFHPTGTPLGSQQGDYIIARCLVKSNADSTTDKAARGTIFVYGIDGVCHQLANQVLFASGGPGVSPLTVSAARGYHVSLFLF